MERIFFSLGALLAGIAVGLGAFGAHALSGTLGPEDLVTFETGVRYQMYHALALLAVAWAVGRWESVQLEWAGWLFLFGILVFSGSLYILVLTGQRWLGAVTPLGGLAFIAGWLLLASAVIRG
ncbi:MAG TPA: DUF423 domain-containing protein [Gemmatimonadetes bacterium]|jgi:uncharacterized membrane protein YgdD (TMEM256/DUF423 family)|nr:DUF423 domain-containing protein [Gemmatimonadota bacterium]HIB10229.1 DUF423 domain-containing protein [Gemmatimonadota bacterium]HIC15357.1 DUF423 domain-containing protein [Gemmatimonadota bacterium]HIN78855.1 DUF423 domain-containing protein [Gemmatimonadota bacterium]